MRYPILSAVLVLAACGKGKSAPPAADTTTAAAPTPSAAPAGGATIAGSIKFTGTPPANPTIDMSEEAVCKAKYTTPPTDPQIVVSGGKLGNVFVYVKSGLPAGASYPAPTTAVTIDQRGCLYHPRVFGVMVGQPIEILNSDPVLHNIKAVPTANRGFNISQPSEGMKTTRTFNTPEVMVPLQCNVHGWMHAFVGVMSHPFFATSGEDGSFTIKGLPAGTYQLEAWHEKLGTQTMTVTVAENGTATADFTFGPKT
ncbi:MAG TPA: carboxypeptidase regulatory-like domain-containing protein [Gemmatimonadales bacterium]|jgi:plastocyanin|nr:carboxypeptidase regulatory-like domain-containing protein [Gemmatimonadales bacterium]